MSWLAITSLILINRHFSASITAAVGRPNPTLVLVLGGVAAILLTTQFVGPIANLFTFARITLQEMGVIAAASVLAMLLLERLKPFWGGRLLE